MEFDTDVDALLEEGMPMPKKMRQAEDKYGGDSDHQSDGEGGVQPMMTKIKTVLKSEWCTIFSSIIVSLGSNFCLKGNKSRWVVLFFIFWHYSLNVATGGPKPGSPSLEEIKGFGFLLFYLSFCYFF